MIEHIEIGIVQEEIYGISCFAIWESLAEQVDQEKEQEES